MGLTTNFTVGVGNDDSQACYSIFKLAIILDVVRVNKEFIVRAPRRQSYDKHNRTS